MAALTDGRKFRKALEEAGFNGGTVFNEVRKSGKRRMKLWQAGEVEKAHLKRQWLLHDNIVEEFGDRLESMYFVEGSWWTGKSLVVVLRDADVVPLSLRVAKPRKPRKLALKTIKEFVDYVERHDLDTGEIYDLFEERLSEQMRDKIYSLSNPDENEPCRAAMVRIGICFDVPRLIDF